MKQFVMALVCLCLVASVITGAEARRNPVIVMETNMGDITIELFKEEAPGTVQNFMWYVNKEFYDGLIFHRVTKGGMKVIQGGGFTQRMSKKAPNAPIENEATNRISNERGTIAMARTGAVHSATSQFFINVGNNAFLDHKSTKSAEFGYCVFGKVIDGMDVVDKIANVETGNVDGYNDVPLEKVIITKVYESKGGKKKAKKKDS